MDKIHTITNSKIHTIMNSNKRTINAYFRANDESHKWPICGRFNVTERAIRRLRGEYPYGGSYYFLSLDAEISRIVNSVD